jgi:hypothetical protein
VSLAILMVPFTPLPSPESNQEIRQNRTPALAVFDTLA